MNKLEYKDEQWTLTVNGVKVPNSHVGYDSLRMRNDEPPMVLVLVDAVEIEGVELSESVVVDNGK